MGLYMRHKTWWLDFRYNGTRIRESTKTSNLRLAELIMAKRRLDVENGSDWLEHVKKVGKLELREPTPEMQQFLDRHYPKTPESTKEALEQIYRKLAEMESRTAASSRRKKASSLSLGRLRDLHIKGKKNKGIATWKDYIPRWKAAIAFFGEDRAIDSVGPDELEAYKERLMETKEFVGKDGEPRVRPATINHYLGTLRAGYILATKRGIKHQNPFASIEFLKVENQRTRMCSQEEFRRLVEASRDPLKVPLLLIYHTGIRNSEIVRLKRKHISSTPKGVGLFLEKTKNSEPRFLPILNQELIEELQRPLDETIPKHSNTISHYFRPTADALGLVDLQFYDLRKSFTTNLRRSGIDSVLARRLTGHKDVRVFDKHYNIVDDDDLWEAASKLQEYLSDG